MPSRRRVQPPRQAAAEPPAPKRQPGVPMSPPILAAAVGTARHDRHMAGVRLGASRRLGAQMRAAATSQGSLSDEERRRHLEEAAYYRYLQRGDQWGRPEDDWFAAEKDLQNKASRS